MARLGKLLSLKPVLFLALMVCVYNVGRFSAPCNHTTEGAMDYASFDVRVGSHVNRDIRMQKDPIRPEVFPLKTFKPKEIFVTPKPSNPQLLPVKTAAQPSKSPHPVGEKPPKPAGSEHNMVLQPASKDKTLKPVVAGPKAATPKPKATNHSLYLPKDYYGTGSIAHHQGLKRLGAESVSKHSFKSPFIVDPHIYSRSTIRKPPGSRMVKTISCYNCPERFYLSHKYNNDFQQCPYSECRLTSTGGMNPEADIMIFWQDPEIAPPTKPKHQVWVYMSWETPPHRSHPSEH